METELFGLAINRIKTEIYLIVKDAIIMSVDNNELEVMDPFTDLDCRLSDKGIGDSEIRRRIEIARACEIS